MLKARRIMGFILAAVLVAALAACSPGATTGTGGNETGAAPSNTGESARGSEEDTPTEAGGETVLKIVGPGLFTTVGETGSVDLVTGLERPGYEVVLNRWNELHPDVRLEIETVPWDNWRAVVQTAALAGDVDVLLHGSSITAIAEPIADYLAQSPELDGKLSMLAMRRTEENGGNFAEYIPYGVTITPAPLAVVLDKDIFDHHGVPVPDASWTLEDILDLAEKTTGTDPVTGQETYGISPIAAGGANKNYIWVSRAMNAEVIEFGPTLKETKIDVTGEKTKEVLNYITALYAFTSPDYLEGLDLGVTKTADNNIAMVITEDINGDYNRIVAGDLLERYTMLPLPTIQEGRHAGITSSHSGDWNMAICNTSDKKDLAWEFIKFMVADEVVQQWIVDCSSLPNNLDALKMVEQAMAPEYYATVEILLSQQPLAFSTSTNECYDSGNFGTWANDITTVLNEMFVGNMDADEAVTAMQKNLDDYMGNLQ